MSLRSAPISEIIARSFHHHPFAQHPRHGREADAPSAPSWRGKRGQQVRRWLERRGRRAVRPLPAGATAPRRVGQVCTSRVRPIVKQAATA